MTPPIPHGSRPTVLVIDDEESFHDIVVRFLRAYRTLRAYNGGQALRIAEEHHVDVAVLDLNLPDVNGLDLLDLLQHDHPELQVIVLTAQTDLRNAVESVERGAFDFLAKSTEGFRQLSEQVGRALLHRERRRQFQELGEQSRWLDDALALLGSSAAPALREFAAWCGKSADSNTPLLLAGPAGVGKEVLARIVHRRSRANVGPFVTVNLREVPLDLQEANLFGYVRGAFPEAEQDQAGKLEVANGGTLFLDRVEEIHPSLLDKLTSALQAGETHRLGEREATEIDVRLIVAARTGDGDRSKQRETPAVADADQFDIPPLCDRRADISGVASLLLHRLCAPEQSQPPALHPVALDMLEAHDWPGNVRELETVLAGLLQRRPGATITPDHIPASYALTFLRDHAGPPGRPLSQRIEAHCRRHLVRVSRDRHQDDETAASAVGITGEQLRETLAAPPPWE